MSDFARSLLFVPGDRPAFIDSALRSEAEAIVFDLEDSVVPGQKPAARDAVRSVLAQSRTNIPLFVRINAPGTAQANDDLRALTGAPCAGFVVPKVESGADVSWMRAEAAGAPLVLLIETPRGVLRALELADAAGPSLVALAFGAEDFRAAMRVETADADPILAFAMPMVAVAAAAVNVPAIDAPEMNVAEHDRLRARCATALALGFHAKFAIHPAQLPIIHETFGPSPGERLWAERVTRAYEDASADGQGSVRLDDRVVDAATVKRARQILERSRP